MPLNEMDHSAGDVVAQMLVDMGLGNDPDGDGPWQVIAAGAPSAPDNQIVVYDTATNDHGRVHTGELQGAWGIQVLISGITHKIGQRKAKDIRNTMALGGAASDGVLNRIVHLETKEYRVAWFSHIGPVLYIGKDTPTSKCSLFTINAFVEVRQAG